MSNSKRLAFAIIEHLSSQLKSGAIIGDAAESLDVSIQCLEEVYGINRQDPAQISQLKSDRSLEEIFQTATKTSGGATAAQPTGDDRAKAEELKSEGNKLMKEEKFKEAIQCYTKAMELDSCNAVYPCNRAAAYSKMGDHQKAIEDCEKAISLDPIYGKAYGRMGLSYQSLNNFEKAKESYLKVLSKQMVQCFMAYQTPRRELKIQHAAEYFLEELEALELDPGSTFYQTSLVQVEEKIKDSQQGGASGGPRPNPGGIPNLGGLDLGSLLTNPAIMNMAQTFMASPQVQHMMTNMMAGSGAGGGAANIFQAAQQFGEQMQNSNPELFEELRGQAQAAVNQHRTQNQPEESDQSNTGGDDTGQQ